MKKSIIFILSFTIFIGFGNIYANGFELFENSRAKDNLPGIKEPVNNLQSIKKTKTIKNKKITLADFYTDDINESNIKDYILEMREDVEESKKINNFHEKIVNVLERLYNEEKNKEL